MWIYEDKEFIPTEELLKSNQGFVYLIVNKLTNKQYIGKKFFWSTKRKQVKGKKKSIKVESDWRQYWSSSEELQKDVELLGEHNFTRIILHLCVNRALCSYLEAKEQFVRGVLESNNWYNKWISCKITKNHLKSIYK